MDTEPIDAKPPGAAELSSFRWWEKMRLAYNLFQLQGAFYFLLYLAFRGELDLPHSDGYFNFGFVTIVVGTIWFIIANGAYSLGSWAEIAYCTWIDKTANVLSTRLVLWTAGTFLTFLNSLYYLDAIFN